MTPFGRLGRIVTPFSGIAAMLALLSPEALAISRHDPQTMNCARIQAIVRSEGEVILRFMSRRNLTLYDRYVAHAGYYSAGEYAQTVWVPTKDLPSCPILRCLRHSCDEH